jgi:hypothetical protein
MRRSTFVRQMPFAVAVACVVGACGSGRTAARSTVPSPPSSSAILLDAGRSAEAATDVGVIAPDAGPSPIEEPALVRASLIRFGSSAKACAALLARSDSDVLRNRRGRGSTLDSVRAGCRVRPASPTAHADGHRDVREPSLVELYRTTAVPRHSNVDTVAAALAFPSGKTDWLVAIESAEESEGMQSMPLGDASGSVEVANAEHVDLVGTEAPELVFVLSVAENPDKRIDFVVCESRLAWCSKPSTLAQVAERSGPWDARAKATETRAYAFRRHPRGVLVATLGEPPMPDRLFPLEDAP